MPPEPSTFRDCIILTGPTGSGKSSLAIELAECVNGEIIAADSMTHYRSMDIGTAKPTLSDRQRVPHHLIDVLDPSESASVAWWLERAAECTADIQARGKIAIVVGGTPLYLKAMLFGLFASPPIDVELRLRLEQLAERGNPETLHAQLAAVDPVTAARLHPNDVRRVVRALEVFHLTGRPISEFQRQWTSPPARGLSAAAQLLCIDLDREALYARIDRRVESMIAAGWLDEVRQIRRSKLSREAAKALGYAELGQVIDGALDLSKAVETIKMRSRQFAKRQLTWFRNWPDLRWVRPELTMLREAMTIENRNIADMHDGADFVHQSRGGT